MRKRSRPAPEEAADPEAAREAAVGLLARREHGREELLAKLTARGWQRTAAELAVTRLAAEGLQSDRRYAEVLVRARILQGRGPRAILAELAARGIGRADAEAALAEAEADWTELARRAVAARFGAAPPSGRVEWLRRARFLAGRGFTAEQVRAALGGDGDLNGDGSETS